MAPVYPRPPQNVTAPEHPGAGIPRPGVSDRWQRMERWLTLLLVALAAAAMVARLPRPYWYDEANTIYYVGQPLARMVTYTINDWFPPGYYFLLRAWVAFFGDTEFATGILSMLFGVIAAGLTYGFGRSQFGSTIARRAALLFWLSETMMNYATETRMYSLLLALAVASMWLFVALLQQPHGWWRFTLYGLLLLCGAYTHYPFWFLILAHGITVLLWSLSRPRSFRRLIPFAITYGAVLVGYAPQFYVLFDRVTQYYFAPGATWLDNIRSTVQMFWQVPFDLLVFNGEYPPQWVAILAATLGETLLLVSIFQFQVRHGSFRIGLRPLQIGLVAILVATTVPLGVLYLVDVAFSRYASFITPFLCILLAIGISRARQAASQLSLFAALAIIVAGVNITASMFIPNHYQDEYWPSAIAALVSRPVMPVSAIVAHHEDAVMLRYYYPGAMPIIEVPLPENAETADSVVHQIRQNGRLWMTRESIKPLESKLADFDAVWVVRAGGAANFDKKDIINNFFYGRCQLAETITIPNDHEWRYAVIQMRRYTNCINFES